MNFQSPLPIDAYYQPDSDYGIAGFCCYVDECQLSIKVYAFRLTSFDFNSKERHMNIYI